MNETVIPMRIEGGEIQVKATLGQTVIKVVAPDEYTGPTEVTPSDQTQVLQTKDRLVREDITINPAPTEILSTDHNGTFTPSDGHVGFSQVNVDVPQRFTLQTIADRSALKNLGEITISVPAVTGKMFDGWTFETIHLPDTITITDNNFPFDKTGIKYVDMPNIENIGNTAFYDLQNFLGTYGDGDGVVKLKKVTFVGKQALYHCLRIHTVYFYKKATISTWAFRASGIEDIYVPWSEGEVADAPWEANNATIHYDTVYDEDGNVVSST